MTRKTHAAAIALALLPCAVLAQSSTVVIYGKLNVDVETLSANGPNASDTRKHRVSSNSSLLGFRGEEALGGGLSAFFQIESSAGVDTGSGTLAGRSSAVGLKGPAGSLLMGQWDTPYKNSTLKLDPFTNKTFAGYGAVLYGNSSPTVGNIANRQAFDRRQKNVIQYWSPESKSGFKGRLAYGMGEEKGTCAVACDPRLLSASGTYEHGPLTLIAAYERHDEYANTATVRTRDDALRLATHYVSGATTFSGIAEQLTYRGNLAATGLPKAFTPGNAAAVKVRNAWGAVTHRIGRQLLRLSYGQSADLKLDGGGPGASAVDTGMRYWAVGYAYQPSKRTELYMTYARIDNDARSSGDFGTAALGGVTAGAHPTGFGMGITHSF